MPTGPKGEKRPADAVALASWDSEEGTSAASVSPSSDVQPHSGPVEPGQEVEHDNIA